MSYQFLTTNIPISDQSEALLQYGGMSGTIKSFTPITSIPDVTTIGPVIGGAIGGSIGSVASDVSGSVKETVTKATFKLGFLWLGFALILLGLIIIAFKNDTVRSGVKSAAKTAALA